MRIPLTRGYFATIDAADAPLVRRFKWRVQLPTKRCRKFYAVSQTGTCRADKRGILMHRLLMGEPAGLKVDHIDGDGLNNSRGNLRLATNAQNIAAQHRSRAGCTSKYRGVCVDERGGWRAQIMARGVKENIGVFGSEEEAARAYDAAAKRLHGEFASLNFPSQPSLPSICA